MDATIVEGENKENNAAKTAGMAAAGIAAGAMLVMRLISNSRVR